MKTVALKLNLSEDADESTILAEVVKLTEDRDSEKVRADDATKKLAEIEKTAKTAEVERTLTELVDGGHVLPGQKDTWLALAEASPESFAAMAEQAKKTKSIELGESGSGEGGASDSDATPSVKMAEAAQKLADDKSISISEATDIILADPKYAGDRDAYAATLSEF
jgi:hypothetical protein